MNQGFSLFYWLLKRDSSPLEQYFVNTTQLKFIDNLEDLFFLVYRFEVENLILGIEDLAFYRQNCMAFLRKIPLEKRRKLFIMLVSSEVRTYDPLQTFLLEVNFLANPADITDSEEGALWSYLGQAKTYFRDLYEPYFRALTNYLEGRL